MTWIYRLIEWFLRRRIAKLEDHFGVPKPSEEPTFIGSLMKLEPGAIYAVPIQRDWTVYQVNTIIDGMRRKVPECRFVAVPAREHPNQK
jgi:hypothetical protein